jgi:hypothetical protein
MHIKLTIKKSGSFTFEQTAIYPEFFSVSFGSTPLARNYIPCPFQLAKE